MADLDTIKKAVDASRVKWGQGAAPPPPPDPSLAAVPHAYDTPPPPRVPLGLAKYDEAAATPEVAESARQAAIDERAKNLVADEHLTMDAARGRAEQELDTLRVMPEQAGPARSRAAIATAATPPTSVGGVLAHVVAPQVFDYSTPNRDEADDKWHSDLVRNYTAITGGDISGWLGHVLHPEPTPAPEGATTSWAVNIADGLDDIGRGLNGGGAFTEAGRTQAVDGVRKVWKGIGDYAEDPSVRQLLEVPLLTVAGAGVARAVETGHTVPDRYLTSMKPEVPGIAGIASRAAYDYLPLDVVPLAMTQNVVTPLPYGDAYRINQWIRDARPSEHFDSYAPLFQHGDADPEVYPTAAATLDALAPEDIPDRDVAGGRAPQFWRDLVKNHPDVVATSDGLKYLAASVARGDDDDTIAKEAASTSYKDLRLLDPSFGPSMGAVAKLAERRAQVQHLTGDASTDAVAKLLAGAMMAPVTQEDGKPVFVEQRGAQVLRLAGGIAQGVYDSDLAVVDAPGLGILARGVAAMTGAAGADEMTQWIQQARVPTRAGLDHALRTGTYDDALRWMGLHEYHSWSQEGDPDGGAGWLARVTTDLEHGERLGPGYKDIYTRAGGDPTSATGSALGLLDVGLDFLNPADEFTFHALGAVPATTARAVKAADLAPDGAKLSLARAAAFGRAGKDPIEAVHEALMDAVQQAHDTGNAAALQHLSPAVVDNVLRTVANPDDVRTAVVASAKAIEARRVDLMQKMLDRGATPEQEALRRTPAYVARAKEYGDLVAAGTLTPQQAQIGLLLDEVRAFNLADRGDIPTAEHYFDSIQREAAGAPPTVEDPRAYYSGGSAGETVTRPVAPTFYSQLRRTVEGIKQDRFTAEQLRGMLAGKVKADEIEWTRLDDFLREHPKTTKAEVLGWLDQNAVEVRVVKRVGSRGPSGRDARELAGLEEEYAQWGDDMASHKLDRLRKLRAAGVEPQLPTKWGINDYEHEQLEMPGGEDYREVLLTLPKGAPTLPPPEVREVVQRAGDFLASKGGMGWTDRQWGEGNAGNYLDAAKNVGWKEKVAPEVRAAVDRFDESIHAAKGEGFTGAHWEEPNVVAHYRANVRRAANGKRYLHLEEVQSDWHQAGREKGYATASQSRTAQRAVGDAMHSLEQERDALIRRAMEDEPPGGEYERRFAAQHKLAAGGGHPLSERYSEITDQLVALDNEYENARDSVPPAPFADTWTDIAIKQALRDAVAEDLDGITWTTSAQQRARYHKAPDGPEYRFTYDRDIPQILNKQGKRFGAKVGSVEVPTGAEMDVDRQVVHAFDIPPKMRDALLHEGQPLFQRTGTGIRGSIEPATAGYLERFFTTADFDTLLHEDGHLLRFMLGDDAVNAMFQHFDHVVDPATGVVDLTRKGEEQAAEAIRTWMRTRVQPDGRLRGILDTLSTRLGDAWVTGRNILGLGSGNPAALPGDVAAYLDAVFNPAARMKRAAIQVLTREFPREVPQVPLSADASRAVVEDTVARAGRTREALRIDTAPAHVKAALGINADVTEIDPLELYKRAVAYAGTELYRKRGVIAGWGGDEPVVALTRRTIVPKSRVDRVIHDIRTRVDMAFGGQMPDVSTSGHLILSPNQRAGLQGLVNEAINSPLGNVLPEDVLAFDMHNPATQMTAEGYNALNDVITDIHAGVGARSNYLAEQVASAPLATAIVRTARDLTAEAGSGRELQRHADDFFRSFVHDYDAAKYMSPALREAIMETMRSMGHTGEEILEDARAAVRHANSGTPLISRLLTGNRRMPARELMGRLIFGSVEPAVHPQQVDRIADLHAWFSGEGQSVRAGGVPELSMEGLLRPTAPGGPARLDEIETAMHTTPIRGASFGMGATADEAEAIRILRAAEANRAARGAPWADVLADPVAFDTLTDALGRVQHGIELRHRMFSDQVNDLLLCAAGSTEKDVLVELPPSERPRFYKAFWGGQWDEMFAIPTVKGHSVVGEAFNQEAAMLAMVARLRARKKLADLGQKMLDIGVADMDRALNDSTLGETYGATFGANGADGYNAKRERVLTWINRITTFGEAAVPRIAEVVDPVTGDVHHVVTSWEGVASAVPNLDDPMEREAYTLAHRYLAQLGWQFGKSTFGDVAVVLPDGGEYFLPAFVLDELMATLDRTAKVGVAYADAQRSAVGRSFSEMSRAVARGEAVKGSYLGLASAPSEEGRIVPLTEQEVAAQSRRRAAQTAGMVAGAGIGGVAFGPAGAVLGGALGRNVVPLAIEAGGKATHVLGKVAGASIGATVGAAKTVVDTLKTVFPFTMALGRVGMTAGLVVVNPAFFVGNAFGALFQTYMRSGIPGVLGTVKVLTPFLGHSATVGRMMAEMGGEWGERIARILPEARPFITDRGQIWTTDMLLRATRSRGLDSSYVKSESSKALYDQIRKLTGHWTDRFIDHPLESATAPLAAWQNLIMEGATAIDNANRVGLFLAELKAGKSADEAAKIAREAAFDYGNLTDFERQTAREIVLFYSYLRQSTNLFWWTAVNHPERVTAMLRLTHGLRYKVDQPDLVLDDTMDNRLVLAFRGAIENDAAKQGVATVSPPVPLDLLPLWVDFMGAFADGSQDAQGKLASHLTPWFQLPIVSLTSIEPYSASDVNAYNSVPNVVVEAGRMATGGLLDEVLGLTSVQNKDPSSDATPGQDRWQATNGAGWFALHELFQMPPFGRSGDTLTMLDRWAPFGTPGPVTSAIRAAEASGRSAGTDRFIRDILRPSVAMTPLLGRGRVLPGGATFVGVRPDLPPLEPVPQDGDLAVPRVGLTPADEARQMMGLKAVQPDDVDVAEAAAYDAERRRAEATMKQQRVGEPQRYNRP